MFEKLKQSRGAVVGYKVSGKLKDSDYKELVPQLDKLIEKYEKIRFLVLFEDFKGFTAHAAYDDMELGLKHRADFEKLAVVGDKKWMRWVVSFARNMIKAEVHHFHTKDLGKAWEWLKSK